VDIQDEGLSVLVSALQKNNSLTHLILTNNNISAKSFTSLSNLFHNTNLTYLSLRALNIGDEGVSIIAKGLASNQTTLTTLDLQNNKIGNNGFTSLLKVLSNTNLQQLFLQWNNISNGKDVIGIIPSTKLISVSLQGNKMREQDIGLIEKMIEKLVKERK